MYSTPKTKPPHFDDKHYTCPDKENCGKNSVVWVIGEVGLNKKANVCVNSSGHHIMNINSVIDLGQEQGRVEVESRSKQEPGANGLRIR